MYLTLKIFAPSARDVVNVCIPLKRTQKTTQMKIYVQGGDGNFLPSQNFDPQGGHFFGILLALKQPMKPISL